MNRRDLIVLIGGAAAWPVAARAQAMPVIGFLSARTPESDVDLLAAFRQGLFAAGYVENKNVAIQYRFADGRYDRLPSMAAELVSRRVAVIVAGGGTQSAAKEATTTIPIVFSMASDPVKSGLVPNLSRPGGNLTGVTNLNVEVGPKLVELLHQAVPSAANIGLLVNPAVSGEKESLSKDLNPAALALGLRLHVAYATTERELDAAFADLAAARAGALIIGTDAFFTSRSRQLAALTLRYALPAIYGFRQFSAAGGLMSYGGSVTDSYRLVGVYVSRILKGDKPADLPVQQSTKIELIINLKTAKTLGVTIPPSMLAIADEVIE
jgi:putative tryptophan/tyrosine transport system substrate-binding protein